MTEIVAMIALVSFFANIVGTLSGFGVGTIMTPILLWWLPFAETVLLVGIIHWFHDIWKVIFFRTGINWPLFVLMGIPSMVMGFIGALLLPFAQPQLLLILLGMLLISFVIFLWVKPHFTLAMTTRNWITAGALSGFCAGLFGIRGPIRGAFFIAFNLSRDTFISTLALIGILLDSTRLITYMLEGTQLSATLAWGLLVFVPVSWLGVYIGQHAIRKVSQERFRTIVSFFLFAAGISLIISALF